MKNVFLAHFITHDFTHTDDTQLLTHDTQHTGVLSPTGCLPRSSSDNRKMQIGIYSNL